MQHKTLIIGGAGFIGINLARYLVRNRSIDLTLADTIFGRNLEDYFSQTELRHIKVIRADFTTPEAYQSLAKDFDSVYMLASVVGVNNTLEQPSEVIRINTALILHCLDWLKTTAVKKVLFTSTSETYAGTTELFDHAVPTNESVPLCIQDSSDPRFTYAITKLLGESAFLNYAKKYNFDATVVRFHNAFGPDMGLKHVIPHIV